MATTEEIEAAAAAIYGSGWDDPKNAPGPKMKEVWRRYARVAIEAADNARKNTATAGK